MVVLDIEVDGEKKKLYMDNKLHNQIEEKVKPKIHKKDWDWVWIVDGPEGCLTGDTCIETTNGNIRIDLIKSEIINVKSFDFHTNSTSIGKAKIIPTNIKKVFEIKLNNNKKVQATKDHTFFVKRNNKILELELKDIMVGDELLCKN